MKAQDFSPSAVEEVRLQVYEEVLSRYIDRAVFCDEDREKVLVGVVVTAKRIQVLAERMLGGL